MLGVVEVGVVVLPTIEQPLRRAKQATGLAAVTGQQQIDQGAPEAAVSNHRCASAALTRVSGSAAALNHCRNRPISWGTCDEGGAS